jgi:AraC-like DNA-binding protein
MLEACRKLTYLPASIASIAYELGFQTRPTSAACSRSAWA